MQFTNWPPTPFNPFPNAATFLLDSNNIAYDDRDVDYEQLHAQAREWQMMVESFGEPPPIPGGTNDLGFDPGVPSPGEAYNYGTNVLWIEIYAVTNDLAYLTLHNTKSNKWYQLLSAPTLDPGYWKPGQVIFNDIGTNQIYFDPVPTEKLPTTFYRGAEGNWKVRIVPSGQAYEPNTAQGLSGSSARFLFYSDVAVTNALTVVYLIGGSAQNGTDYVSIASSATIPVNSDEAYVDIEPYEDNLIEFDENVVLRLVVTNGYVVDPTQAKEIVWVSDNFGTNEAFSVAISPLNRPFGIDYHSPSNSLVISLNGDPVIPPATNFVMIKSNGVLSSWGGISNVLDEVKLTIGQTNSAGFTNGDMFFGSDTAIGWLSADGSTNDYNWCILTNAIVTNALHLRGSLYVDQTGIWSNQLIAVTSDQSAGLSDKGVWRVDSDRNPTLIANIYTRHLEGVLTLPNNTNMWGPWTGKIITGDEDWLDENGQPKPLIYAIGRDGVVSSYDLGIHTEDFDIIQTNRDLYCVLLNDSDSAILKMPAYWFTNYVGSLLITQAGERSAPGPRFFIVKWDSAQADFNIRRILLPLPGSGTFEHVTFAPTNIFANP